MENLCVLIIFNLLVPLFRPSRFRVVLFIRNTTLFHATVLKKRTNGKPIFKMAKSINRSNILNGK